MIIIMIIIVREKLAPLALLRDLMVRVYVSSTTSYNAESHKIEKVLCMFLLCDSRCRERKISRCIVLEIFRTVFNVNVDEAICMIFMKQSSTSFRGDNETNFETFR